MRDRWLMASYAAAIIGFVLFSEMLDYGGKPRHFGFLFIALIGVVWMWRALPGKSVSAVWLGLLLVNAVSGLTTLASELRPYSQGREAARWLERVHLQDDFLIGSRDAYVSPIAGYLNRRIYYLECECFGTYVKWNNARVSKLSQDEFLVRFDAGAGCAAQERGYRDRKTGLELSMRRDLLIIGGGPSGLAAAYEAAGRGAAVSVFE